MKSDPRKTFHFPELGLKKTGLSEREIGMATRLVDDMTEEWDPRQYRDTYREDLLARVEAKAKAGKSAVVTQPEEGKEPRRSELRKVAIDALLNLLQAPFHLRTREVDRHSPRGTPLISGVLLTKTITSSTFLVQRRKDKQAATPFLRKMLKHQGRSPRGMVTDKLKSYGAARERSCRRLCTAEIAGAPGDKIVFVRFL